MIKNKFNQKGILFWITGLSGSGKTSIAKKILPLIRKKYGPTIHLDGDALRTEAATEKDQLITHLREILEQTSRRSLTEKDQEESEFLQQKLSKVPIPIFIG